MFDAVIESIAQYVERPQTFSDLANKTALDCIMDTIGCGLLALNHPDACAVLGEPFSLERCGKVRIPGTNIYSPVVKAAFDMGALNRWLDYNDTWLAQEWGHPSDNLAPILACAQHLSDVGQPLPMQTVIDSLIKAYEIQGILALNHAFNACGLDHVMLVKLASCAVCAHLLGLSGEGLRSAISQCWVDGQSLRTYRHAPNTGPRKSWAAGDAAARGVFLAWLSLKGQPGYPTALTAKTWGFQDALFKSQPITLSQPFDSYVMENILYKIAYPAEFHAQTAVEAAIALREAVSDWEQVEKIDIQTQAAGMRIISKKGPLHNPADRDHCLEYMVAVALLDGTVTHESYLEGRAQDPQIDSLRERMVAEENPDYTQAYFDPGKRAIPNSLQITFKDGTQTQRVQVDYPLGHRLRREEAHPLLEEKFIANVSTRYSKEAATALLMQWRSGDIAKMSVSDFMALWPNTL